MSSVEDQVRAATRAQAATMREVRPLRLRPAAGDEPEKARSARSRSRPARHLRSWLAPVGAAAAVLALAISLVVVRDHSSAPLAKTPAPALASSSTGTQQSLTAAPRYYAAVVPLAGTPTVNGLVVNGVAVTDTVTGKRVAFARLPLPFTFTSVSAAADDRTFVTYVMNAGGSSGQAGRWYEARFTPGAATPLRFFRLPVPALANVQSMAVSQSGTELAVVVDDPAGSPKALQVYSVTTGRLVHAWPRGLLGFFNSEAWRSGMQTPELTWIDGDQDLAFPSVSVFQQNKKTPATWIPQIWRLRLSRGGSNVIASSNLVWSMNHDPVNSTSPQRCLPYSTPMLSADGQTVVCPSTSAALAQTGPGTWRQITSKAARWTVAWLAFPITAPGTASTLYSTTVPAGRGIALQTAWINASGSSALAEWGPLSEPTTVSAVHLGLASHGTFTAYAAPRVSGTSVGFFLPGVSW
jgi:hypothetical protein